MTEDSAPVGTPPPYYDARQIGILAFIFGPFAGVYLLWRNWITFGDKNKALHTLIVGVAATLVVSKFADLLPDALWLILFVTCSSSGFFAWLAHAWQGTVIEALKAKGLPRGSSWRFCGIGILLLVLYAILDSLI